MEFDILTHFVVPTCGRTLINFRMERQFWMRHIQRADQIKYVAFGIAFIGYCCH